MAGSGGTSGASASSGGRAPLSSGGAAPADGGANSGGAPARASLVASRDRCLLACSTFEQSCTPDVARACVESCLNLAASFAHCPALPEVLDCLERGLHDGDVCDAHPSPMPLPPEAGLVCRGALQRLSACPSAARPGTVSPALCLGNSFDVTDGVCSFETDACIHGVTFQAFCTLIDEATAYCECGESESGTTGQYEIGIPAGGLDGMCNLRIFAGCGYPL